MDDAELVRATRNADVSAFTAIFDRYAARVHDLALAMLRDRSAALEVVESTFLEASLRLQGLEEAHRLPVWLLAVTRRNAALRAGPVAGGDRQPALPNDDPERVRLASLVWEAVADLPLRERTLIDLDLRQGLDGHDLADALGVTLAQSQDLQARMRDRIEKGLSGYVIAKTAEGRCPDLTKVLKGWDSRFTPKDSGRIARHVESCRTCNQIRFGLPSPFALYAAALPAPFPATVRPRVLERVVLPVPPGGAPAMASAPHAGSSEPDALPYQQPLAAAPSSYATAAPLPQAAANPYDAAPAPWLDPFEPPPPPAGPEPGLGSQPAPAPPSFPEAPTEAYPTFPAAPEPDPPAPVAAAPETLPQPAAAYDPVPPPDPSPAAGYDPVPPPDPSPAAGYDPVPPPDPAPASGYEPSSAPEAAPLAEDDAAPPYDPAPAFEYDPPPTAEEAAASPPGPVPVPDPGASAESDQSASPGAAGPLPQPPARPVPPPLDRGSTSPPPHSQETP